MMEAIFLNIQAPFEKAVEEIYSAIGISNYAYGNSANVLGGIYGIVKILGLTIKVEENSYDYEDDYKYSIFIKKDALSNIKNSEENVRLFSHIIIDLLVKNLRIVVALEVEDELKIYNPE